MNFSSLSQVVEITSEGQCHSEAAEAYLAKAETLEIEL